MREFFLHQGKEKTRVPMACEGCRRSGKKCDISHFDGTRPRIVAGFSSPTPMPPSALDNSLVHTSIGGDFGGSIHLSGLWLYGWFSLENYKNFLNPRKDSKFLLSRLEPEKLTKFKMSGSLIWLILCDTQLDRIAFPNSQFVELYYCVRSIAAKYVGEEEESRYFFKQVHAAVTCQRNLGNGYFLLTYLYLVTSRL